MAVRIALTEAQWFDLAHGVPTVVGDAELVPPRSALYLLTDADVYLAAEGRGYAREDVPEGVLDAAAHGFAHGADGLVEEAVNGALDDAGLVEKDADA